MFRRVLIALVLSACACPRASNDSNGPEIAEVEAPPPDTRRIPDMTTPADQLSTAALRHHELVRIRRNFGDETFQIALDAWTPVEGGREITDVRLWWVRTDRNDQRGPFSEKSRKHFDIDYQRLAPDRWVARLRSDKKSYDFLVELGDTGEPAAFATVDADGRVVPHCRVHSGELLARKLFGAPIGIKSLAATCTADDGRELSGDLVATEG